MFIEKTVNNNSVYILKRSVSLQNVVKSRPQTLKKSLSLKNLQKTLFCNQCSVQTFSSSETCILCNNRLEMMNIAHSPCKNCSITPVEQPQQSLYRNYDILTCDRPPPVCSCQKSRANFISLSNIQSYSCSVAPKPSCDSKPTDGALPKNVRTTASGINKDSTGALGKDNATLSGLSKDNPGILRGATWKYKSAIPTTSWTCKRCTLLNSSGFMNCEACESPYSPDLNSNVNPSVIIKVIQACEMFVPL